MNRAKVGAAFILLGTTFVMAAEPSAALPQQLRKAVCTITGSSGRGTGFVANFNGKPVIITNQHVILGQENMKIENLDGTTLKPLRGSLASGVDVAMFLLSELPSGIVPFELSKDITLDANEGDSVLIVGNSLGDGTLTTTAGQIKSLGPKLIEHSAPTFTGNSGSPIYHIKSGKVIGVDTESRNSLANARWDDQASATESGAAVTEKGVRLFGHRLDNEKKWQELDWKRMKPMTEQIERARSMGKDALNALTQGNFVAIKDRVWRERFVYANEMWFNPEVTDYDAYSAMISAIDNMIDSLSYNMRRLKNMEGCFSQEKQSADLVANIEAMLKALEIVKGDFRVSRSAYTGAYKMSPKVKALIYPDGTILVFED